MKRILTIIAAIAIAIGATAKEKKDTTVCFKISPAMSCVNCENKIKGNLRFEKGITAIEANAPGDQVTIRYNKTKTDASKIEKAFGKIGYTAKAEAAGSCTGKKDNCDKNGKCDKKEKEGACCKDGCKKDGKKDGKTCCKKENKNTSK